MFKMKSYQPRRHKATTFQQGFPDHPRGGKVVTMRADVADAYEPQRVLAEPIPSVRPGVLGRNKSSLGRIGLPQPGVADVTQPLQNAAEQKIVLSSDGAPLLDGRCP